MTTVGIPLLIPKEGREALLRKEINSPGALVEELGRMAALGSNWASAALATIQLYPDASGARDIEQAKRLLTRPASEGNSYALYVLAWAEVLSGNAPACVSLLKRAALAGFSPAVLDLASAVQSKDPRSSVSASLELYRRAASLGHVGARGRIFELWMKGRMGPARRIPGLCGFVLNSVRITLRLQRDPLSENTFFIHNRIKSPPIRQRDLRRWKHDVQKT